MKISAKTKTKKKRGARASHVVTSPSIEPVHGWFGLTYANYLVLPRTVLQSMPPEWQEKFVKLLEEARVECKRVGVPSPHAYRVQPVGADGRYVRNEVPHYRHAPKLFAEVTEH